MQTFLPYPNFVVSVMSLDYRRLGKQRVETRQIQTAIETVRKLTSFDRIVEKGQWQELCSQAAVNQGMRKVGWASHPCTEMWCNNTLALMLYGDCCIREWVRRGYNNNMPLMLSREYTDVTPDMRKAVMPDWLGNENFHASHRSNLIRKDPEYYSDMGWEEGPELEYVWPVLQ